ncbi:helix-turn-helix transcriptional regulator [Sphingomonas sp. H39-1-10]|uniref:helix-turn-helix transcriptional regulator n=1 Tax=Sphingomonas TaxID=13687 RepID=UPI001C40B792|nr:MULTISPECIES: helix-turn-helix transcriptional regulator [Sphingomonas]MDF0489743.1 helix-turn-helix transcriptional regulator [Sphingomonas pollutisoli]
MATRTDDNRLGTYLRDRRTRLDPAVLGFPPGRRRTPGLRREEVAQRAHISATWYTWLEQGRGGAPSADVLNRIARALMLTDVEREHIFLLALGRPPEVRYQSGDGVTPRLQRVLDAFGNCPALVKTLTWDVVAWNRAAALVLTDYGALPPDRRNILRFLFCDPRVRAAQHDWESVARFVVAAFRADVTRAGAAAQASALIEELCATSAEFARLWADNDVRQYGGGLKQLRHPVLGPIAFEYSAFAVDGRPDLGLIVYNPATAEDAARIDAMLHPERGEAPGIFTR